MIPSKAYSALDYVKITPYLCLVNSVGVTRSTYSYFVPPFFREFPYKKPMVKKRRPASNTVAQTDLFINVRRSSVKGFQNTHLLAHFHLKIRTLIAISST